MEILYPYNETLPKRTAHDVYVFRNCASLSEIGLPVTLLCGWRSQDDTALFQHYQVDAQQQLQVRRLPILRKVGPFSCNALFFWQAQRHIKKNRPKVVISSVFKQAQYHVSAKRPDTFYVYEAHQLGWYPNSDTPARRQTAAQERAILEKMDLVTVTTSALKNILRQAPYSLTNPIEVVPLAVDTSALPPTPARGGALTLMYIGQLYASQGVELLLRALALTQGRNLEIAGGTEREIAVLKALTNELDLGDRVHFHGFLSPSKLPALAQRADAFVAPFHAVERMPYVAHTKLLEYASWGKTVVAPRLDIVREHLPGIDEKLLFEPGDAHSLAESLNHVAKGSGAIQPVDYSWRSRAHHYAEILRSLT